MRKFTFFGYAGVLALIASATLIFIGCSNDSDGTTLSDGTISLRGISQKVAATEITTSNFDNFRIYAYTNSSSTVADSDIPSFMYGVDVKRVYNNNEYVWTYSPVRYWPTSATNVHFYAYAPVSSVADFSPAEGDMGMPILKYTVPRDVINQEDLLWANAEGLNRDTNGDIPVPMVFNHAMSEVIFMAESAYETVSHSVTRIELFGMREQAQLDLMNGIWTINDPNAYTYYAIDLTDANGNGMDVLYNNLTILTSSDEGNAMMILPQETVPGQEVTNYDATTLNPNDGNAYLRVTFGSTDTESGATLVPDGYTYIVPLRWTNNDAVIFEQGTRYIIYLTLTGTTNGGGAEDGEAPDEPGLGELKTISFEAHVNDFVNWVTIPITM